MSIIGPAAEVNEPPVSAAGARVLFLELDSKWAGADGTHQLLGSVAAIVGAEQRSVEVPNDPEVFAGPRDDGGAVAGADQQEQQRAPHSAAPREAGVGRVAGGLVFVLGRLPALNVGAQERHTPDEQQKDQRDPSHRLPFLLGAVGALVEHGRSAGRGAA